MSTRPPSARALRTKRAQALMARSRALLLCQATAAGAGDLARARVLARAAGASHTMVVGSGTFGAVVAKGWQVPLSNGTLFVVAVENLEHAPALWRALGSLARVCPQAMVTPDRWWTHADLVQWEGCSPAVWPGLLSGLVQGARGLAHTIVGRSWGPVEMATCPPVVLLQLLRAHSSAG